jgi:hypothetical protein
MEPETDLTVQEGASQRTTWIVGGIAVVGLLAFVAMSQSGKKAK